MKLRQASSFLTVRTEGALLPMDLLERVVEPSSDLEGLTPDTYHLAAGERVNEVINRSWNRLKAAWTSFSSGLERLPATDPATGFTRDRWLYVLFQELGYGRLVPSKAIEIDGKSYPISHIWQSTPIHLVGQGTELDRRSPGVAGAARSSPHSMVQEYLNRSTESLWGIVSNGLSLRILRDNASLVRQAFVEFDLKTMMEGEIYSDFVLLWLVCHQSRVEVTEEGGPQETWLERWSKVAESQGARVLEKLRIGVESAIASLGKGFIQHPKNSALREDLRSGELYIQRYYEQLLRLCYRLIFLFVAEDRELLLDPDAPSDCRERYMRLFSTTRMRQLAGQTRGSRHPDLFKSMQLVMDSLGNPEGLPALGIKPLGSFLWSRDATPNLNACDIANDSFLAAIRALSFAEIGGLRRGIDYKNLGSEELGSVYESLLELHVNLEVDAGVFELDTTGGHERRTSGSYYTPTSLISELLDSALDPVIARAARSANPVEALLNLKVVDPATGSGHFLVAAANRIARAVAVARTGEEEPPLSESRRALREVVSNCIYGVDINELAVELCKVSLWMETLEPGKPLSFLDHRIRAGNSILGSTPYLIDRGVPDDAFKPLHGDERSVCSELKGRNKRERSGQTLFASAGEVQDLNELSNELEDLGHRTEASISEVLAKEDYYEQLRLSESAARARLAADAWCVAFLGPKKKESPGVTEAIVWQARINPDDLDPGTVELIRETSAEYKLFHWHVEFPDVFFPQAADERTTPGFDCVLGNPPWEKVKLQEREWFQRRAPYIAEASTTAARRKLIKSLADDDPHLFARFQLAIRSADAVSHFLHNSDRYPLCGRGDVNTYAIFAELMRSLVQPTGRVGAILPTGIATDFPTQFFFRDLVESRSLESLFGFENEEFIFPAIHHATRFCLVTLTGPARPAEVVDFVFFARRVEQLRDEDRRFTLTPDDIKLMNPNSGTCPVFRWKRDAEIVRAIYERVPVLIAHEPVKSNNWEVSFGTMFHMANDSALFAERDELEADGWMFVGNDYRRNGETRRPLYEAKMFHHFDHRFGTYEGQTQAQANQGKLPELTPEQHSKPDLLSLPRYWVHEREVDQFLESRTPYSWLVAWRNITGATVKRTMIAAVLPRVAVGHSAPLLFSGRSPKEIACLVANLTSFVLDYVTRTKLGGTNLTFFIVEQLPVLPPTSYERLCPWDQTQSLRDWISSRVAELVYTAVDLEEFATDVGCSEGPFIWDEERRAVLRAELDAAFLHLYAIDRPDAERILDSFPVVARDEQKEHGEYFSKRLILEKFDELSSAVA